ncbi:MAG: hypothetical protein OER90_20710 [Gemmatimonadota bacterium]|nr:hypothetical protein [Gemmatimonadota bacterium]
MSRVRTILLMAAGAFATTTLAAQDMSDTLAASIARERLISVETAWGRYDLADPRLDGGELSYAKRFAKSWRTPDSIPSPFPMTGVFRIQRRSGDQRLLFAVAGGLLAGVGSAVASEGRNTGETIGIGLLFSVLGAGGGWLIGSSISRWETMYQRPGPP